MSQTTTPAPSEPFPSAGVVMPESLPLRLIRWIGEHPTIVITLTGALAYVGLRLAFVSFYKRFGVTPEDVGYDYGTVLTTTLPGMALLLVAFAVPMVLIIALFEWRVRRVWVTSDRALEAWQLLRRGALLLFGLLPLYAIVGLIWLSSASMEEAADDAARGFTVDGVPVLGVPVFPWSVRPAVVTPITKDAQEYARGLGTVCAMYLGASNNHHIIWDFETKTVLRVPITAVQVDVGRFYDPERCRDLRPPQA